MVSYNYSNKYIIHYEVISCSIDASKEIRKIGRLVNHNKTFPNATVKIMELNHKPKLGIFAKRLIGIGEELCYDYGERRECVFTHNPWLAK